MPSIEELSTFCKKKGFVFPSSEIYGGMSGSYDYGPLGVELKNNIKQHWWKTFVKNRQDVYGIDGSIISSSKVWHASGHVDNFEDLLVEDVKTHQRYRADHLVEDALGIATDGMSAEDLWQMIKLKKIKSPNKNDLTPPKKFNLMFKTSVGPVEDENSIAYMRPETAQLIFTVFKNVADSSRVKLPFGIAQIGKAFRNEISPRDFLFRTREFEQMEIEYFLRQTDKKCPLLIKKHLNQNFLFLPKSAQPKGKHRKVILSDLIKKGLVGEWHAYWLAESYLWYLELGLKEKNLRIREHVKDELSHYSTVTFDVEYNFVFGWKEIHGNADRGKFDLTQHQKFSGKSMEIFDEETKKKLIPSVIEPSFGVDRAFLAVLSDAYDDDKKRGNIVLKLDPKIAPIQVGVFPLVNKLENEARKVFDNLKDHFVSVFDKSGSIGKRYARADEQGIPFCITFDFDSLKDKSVTVRNRNTTKQQRIKISKLSSYFLDLTV